MSGISRRAFTAALFTSGSTLLESADAQDVHIEKQNSELWKLSMLTLTEQMMHSTLLIQCRDAQGNLSAGTGFVFFLFNHGGQHVPVLVTNKHVIAGAREGVLVFTEANTDGSPNYGSNFSFRIDEFSNGWLGHPDPVVDLTIFPLAAIVKQFTDLGKRPSFIGLDESLVPTPEKYKELTPLEDVVVIGYPDGISDQKNNVPVFRRGITATPVYLDFSGKKEFLVDAAIFPGSSGSPVFLYNQGTWQNRDGSTHVGNRLQLLGVVYAVALHTTDGEILIVPAPTQTRSIAKSHIPNNLGLCIKAQRVLEFEPVLVEKGYHPPEGYKMRAGFR